MVFCYGPPKQIYNSNKRDIYESGFDLAERELGGSYR